MVERMFYLLRRGTMPDIIGIRFVGGPWHNRITDIEPTPNVLVVLRGKGMWSGNVERHRYYLTEYYTPMGTRYLQYVHRDLIEGGRAVRSTYVERMPVWRINRRLLEAKIRNRLKGAV